MSSIEKERALTETLRGKRRKRARNWRRMVLFSGVGILFLGLALIAVTESPEFCRSCHNMDAFYKSWKESPHRKVNCLSCHTSPGLSGFVGHKEKGLLQLVHYITGSYGPKPSAEVPDSGCLRSGCHSRESLNGQRLSFLESVKFSHAKHFSFDKTEDRDTSATPVKLKCTSCHYHLEGSEHFKVEAETCFVCHFEHKTSPAATTAELESECLRCHEIPEKPIIRAGVEINHREFAKYENIKCGHCHWNLASKVAVVDRERCLSCHFEKESNLSVASLHDVHVGKSIACIQCHSRPEHKTQPLAISEELTCQHCHRDTHRAQREIYLAEGGTSNSGTFAQNPMVLTNVDCQSCHTFEESGETSESFGQVARGNLKACDNCHKPGYGKMLVSDWQKKVTELYDSTFKDLESFEEKIKLAKSLNKGEKILEEASSLAQEARKKLALVKADSSWGVHNLSYTENVLKEARKAISGGSKSLE